MSILSDDFSASYAYDALRDLPLAPRRVKKIAILGDSYVGGSGGSTFAHSLAAALRTKYGDAGAGYIPWFDGKLGAVGHSANWLALSTVGPGTIYYRWDDVAKTKMLGGMGYRRLSGAGWDGADQSEYVSCSTHVDDSFKRGAADTFDVVKIHFTLLSERAGFLIRQTNQNINSSVKVSSGARFSGSKSASTSLVASSVEGIIGTPAVRLRSSGNQQGIILGGGTGGAGTYNTSVSETLSSETMQSDPNVSPVLGLPQSLIYKVSPGGNNIIQVLGAYGDVVLSGIEHYNGNAGVTITDLGLGGTTAYQWASLDPIAQQAYWRNIGFDLVIVVLGMNDRSYSAPSQYGTSMSTIVNNIKASGKTKIILARQTDPDDAGSSFLPDYTSVLQSIALSSGCGYIDEREASPNFATYAAANVSGLMLDGVHRSLAGNNLIGAYYASKLQMQLI